MNIFDRYRRALDRNRHRNQMRRIAAYNKKPSVKSGEKQLATIKQLRRSMRKEN